MITTTATALPLIMACNGSRLMPPAYPETDTDHTKRDEGDAAHWLALQWFNGVDPDKLVNTAAPNGFRITSEMIEYVASYVIELDTGQMEIETTFAGASWEVRGRADHIKYRMERAALTIDDFKYGRSLVSPENNWTLIAHAIGYITRTQIHPETITFRIHQPRGYHRDGTLRIWTIGYNDLLALWRQLDATLTNPSDTLTTGPHCKHCPALANCAAASEARQNAIDTITRTFVDTIPNDALAHELDTVKYAQAVLEAHADALEELAKHRIGAGQVIPNYSNEPRYGNSVWAAGLDGAVLTMTTGIDCTKPGTITPAEAKRRGVPEAIIKTLTSRPLIGSKLVRVSADDRAKRLLGK
jgi:hypothetical protein